MSLATVERLSAAWHEAVALSGPEADVPLPAPWRAATTIGDVEILPLDTAAAIVAEGIGMKNCARLLIDKVRRGDSYLYSARDGDRRIATIEVCRRDHLDKTTIFIGQMRGPCNALLPPQLQAKLTRWAREGDRWTLPIHDCSDTWICF
jgi:hypothetical protein